MKSRGLTNIWTADTTATWITVGLASILFGIYTSQKGEMLGPIFRQMKAAMPELAWAAIFLLIGMAHLLVAVTNCRHRVRVLAASLGCAVWVFTFLSIMGGVHPFPPIAGEAAIILASFWLFVRSMTDAD